MKTKIFFPRIWQSILIAAMGIGFQLAVGIVLGVILITSRSSQTDLLIATLIASPICTLLAAVFGIFLSKTPLKSFIENRLDSKIKLLYSFFFFIGVYFVVLLLGGILETFLPYNDALEEIFTQGFNSWLGIIAIVVLAPIFEELLFRGIILRGFIKNYGVARALIFSSFLFGIFHMNLIQSITTSILGFALGWIYIKTGSLWVSMLFHGLNNGISTLLYHLSISESVGDITLFLVMIPAIALGVIFTIFLARKPDNVSHILSERDEALRKRVLIETRQAEMQAFMMQNNPYYNFQPQFYAGEVQNSGGNQYDARQHDIRQYDIRQHDVPQHDVPQFDIPQNNMYEQYYTPPIPQVKHPGLGIASFIISVVVGVSELILFILVVSTSIVARDAAYNTAIIFALVAMLGSLANLAGIGLGAAGAAKKNSKKIFSILGIVFNSATLLIFILLIVLGLFMANTLQMEQYMF